MQSTRWDWNSVQQRVKLSTIGELVIRMSKTKREIPCTCTAWRSICQEYRRERRFETEEMEQLFQRYVLQANKIHLTHLLGLLIATLTVMFLGLGLIFTSKKDNDNDTSDLVTVVCVLTGILVFCVSLAGVVFHKKTNEMFLLYISYALTATFAVLEMVLVRNSANLWATAFFVYITYALLPIRLLEATLSGLSLSLVHVPPLQREPSATKQDNNEKLVNFLLLLAVNVVGVLTHFPADMAKRKAFTEIRQYVKIKISIQKETMRQQRLLMSVLPEHLIEEMKNDLAKEGGSISARKIYMKTYEPVSILFADIVGFTALADRRQGSFVVELLDDLFSNFDRLARRNRCMRIKLLGDCYYCVCGLPKPSTYHASHCVDMGLDMIYCMQTIREKYEVDVDIRVGIHTGKLQCGVLGLKKWQFDIWSSDVELANNMESGGVPGKVHISEATKNCLTATNEMYTIEPAYGSSREPALKDMETFFVTPSKTGKVQIKQRVSMRGPVSGFYSSKHKGEPPIADGHPLGEPAVPTVPLFNPVKRERDIEREVIATLHNSINSRSIRRLKKKYCKSTVLRFKERTMERKYNQEPDRMLTAYFIASFVVFSSMAVVQLSVMPGTPLLFLCTGIGMIWVIVALVLVIRNNSRNLKCYSRNCGKVSNMIRGSRNLSQFLALATVCVSYIVIAIPMVTEESYVCKSKPDIEMAERSLLPIGSFLENPQNNSCVVKTLPYPEHTLLYTILIMIMTGAFQIVMFMYKLLIMLGLCFAYAVQLITAPYFMKSVVVAEAAIKYFLMIMALASFLLLMLIQSQQSEIVHRLDFIWKINARSDSENVQQLSNQNAKLLENILPAHVAKYYVDRERPSDEIYHEECPSACILFACITNFSFSDVGGADSERNVTILHDIISDIDELLNNDLLSSIEKIKCTGPIYMAASGLSLKDEKANTYEHVVAMAHFALTLREHIPLINQRHNTSFGIKIGICMGPVVAGVIGASMPQYDIWGNTVNVASRMYSTGIENHIQVTQNVADVVKKHGFQVKERGSVFVKGKGSMITFFLQSGPSNEELMKRKRAKELPEPPAGSGRGSQTRRSRKLSRESQNPPRNPRNSTSTSPRGSKTSSTDFKEYQTMNPRTTKNVPPPNDNGGRNSTVHQQGRSRESSVGRSEISEILKNLPSDNSGPTSGSPRPGDSVPQSPQGQGPRPVRVSFALDDNTHRNSQSPRRGSLSGNTSSPRNSILRQSTLEERSGSRNEGNTGSGVSGATTNSESPASNFLWETIFKKFRSE